MDDAVLESVLRERLPGIAEDLLSAVEDSASSSRTNAWDLDVPTDGSKLGGVPVCLTTTSTRNLGPVFRLVGVSPFNSTPTTIPR